MSARSLVLLDGSCLPVSGVCPHLPALAGLPLVFQQPTGIRLLLLLILVSGALFSLALDPRFRSEQGGAHISGDPGTGQHPSSSDPRPLWRSG
jgi:hypothetical protein